MRWEIKRRNNGNEKDENIYANCRSWMLSHFKKFLMTAKAMCVCASSCTIEVFRLEKKLQAYLVGLPEYCNTWECFTYCFEAEKQVEWVFLVKKYIY